jgi:integrase
VPEPGVLLFYSPEEIEAIGRSLQAGFHRPAVLARGELEQFEDDRDCEAIRVAAYSGLRLGELLALRWRDVDWTGSALTISRSLSSGVEGTTKTGHVRRVPMADQAAAALDRLSHRQDFVSPDDTSSVTRWAGRWTARRCAAATSAPVTPLAYARCAGMTCATRSGRCWSPVALTW